MIGWACIGWYSLVRFVSVKFGPFLNSDCEIESFTSYPPITALDNVSQAMFQDVVNEKLHDMG